MLLGIIITWLVVNALIVAFLLLHPLRHFSTGTTEPAPASAAARTAESQSQRSMV